MRRILPAIVTVLLVIGLAGDLAADDVGRKPFNEYPEEPPSPEIAARLINHPGPVTLIRDDGSTPGWTVLLDGAIAGHIGSTWELSRSVGYSGQPLDVLFGISPDAVLTGAELVRHSEPILTLGISNADIQAYVDGFTAIDLKVSAAARENALPDVISRATVSTGVIRDSILRSARSLALGRSLVAGDGGIDRVSFEDADWNTLVASGAIVNRRVDMTEAHAALKEGRLAPEPGSGAFLDLWVGLIDPPTIGWNLLGQQQYSRAIGGLSLDEAELIVAASGLHSPRGTNWRRNGVFDRIAVIQGDTVLTFTEGDFTRVEKLAIIGAPAFREMSLFRLDAGTGFDPTEPFSVEVRATRASDAGDVVFPIRLDYQLPARFLLAQVPADLPLWEKVWQDKRPEIAAVAAMLATLTLILLLQESFVSRPKLYKAGRLAFLATTLIVLGWGLNGQLSVVQVVAFLHSLLSGFRWETFLIDPVIFLLWSFVALGLLFWGRGVYCGWLCPFGALQELTNRVAQALNVPQISVPQPLHERLWILKYALFVGIVALSFYSMEQALILAEAEPFKTAISMRMVRAWPFVSFVVAILIAGLFIERFYCRYLCPLGAGLAIPAKLKIFDWLHRRPQCGRECRLCEQKCTVGAIDPIGRINPNECILCLKCQWIFHDPETCTVLKRRVRGRSLPDGASS